MAVLVTMLKNRAASQPLIMNLPMRENVPNTKKALRQAIPMTTTRVTAFCKLLNG